MILPHWLTRPLYRLTSHIPPGQVVRYLIVGVWNTAFGYGLYAGFTYVLTGRIPFAYMVASVLANVIAISVAFIGYKWFVFKTEGNYLREYFRCYVVYGTAFLVTFALLPIVVGLLNWTLGPWKSVPYIAGAILTGGSVVVSFVGHRQFSFAVKNEEKKSESP